jgi:hypothetical protein
MRTAFVLDGDAVIFDPQFGAATVTVRPGTIRAAQAAFKVGGKAVCVLGDEASVQVSGCVYMTAAHPVPGQGTLTIEALGSDQQSRRTAAGGQHTLLKGTQMKARFTVVAPAKGPPPGSVPDATTVYSGTARFGTGQSVARAESAPATGGATGARAGGVGVAPGGAAAARAANRDAGDAARRDEPVEFRIRVQDRFGPAANEPFVLTVGGVAGRVAGRTDAQGGVAARIPRSARRGRLEVGEGVSRITLRLEFDALASIDTPAGQSQRLAHLGFAAAGSGGSAGAGFIDAVRAFQRAQRLPADGRMDEASRAALLRAHGC